MVFHTRAVGSPKQQKVKIPVNQPGLFPQPIFWKSPYFVTSHSFDMNLEILYSFLPSCFPIDTFGLV